MKRTCDSCKHRDSNTETCNFWGGEFPKDNTCSKYSEVVLNTIILDAYDIQRILKGQVLEVELNGNIIAVGADLQDTRGMKLMCVDKHN